MLASEILKKRRDRAIASILNVKEREVDPMLTGLEGGERASRALRKVVLDQINDLYDIALDVVGSTDAKEMEFNADLWLARIQGTLEQGLTKIEKAVESGNGSVPEDAAGREDVSARRT